MMDETYLRETATLSLNIGTSSADSMGNTTSKNKKRKLTYLNDRETLFRSRSKMSFTKRSRRKLRSRRR